MVSVSQLVLFSLSAALFVCWYRMDDPDDGIDGYSPLRTNCHNFGNAPIFPLAPSSGQKFNFSNTLVYEKHL